MCECQGNPLARVTLALGLPYLLVNRALGIKRSLDQAQIGLLYGFNSKFLTSIPAPFICESPPGYQSKVLPEDIASTRLAVACD